MSRGIWEESRRGRETGAQNRSSRQNHDKRERTRQAKKREKKREGKGTRRTETVWPTWQVFVEMRG